MTATYRTLPPQLLDWLLFEVGNKSDLAEFLDDLGEQLRRTELGVWRITLLIPTLHPQQRAYGFTWTEGGATAVTPRAHGI